MRIVPVSFGVEAVTESVANVLAGATGTIRSGLRDGCSVDLVNVAQVR